MQCDAPTKQPAQLFYQPTLDCVQSLLSHPLLAPHISFVPRRVWTSAAQICHVYEDWLSGEWAWDIQDVLPEGATVLGVVLSLDKTNISIMSRNHMAYPLLISLANIDPVIHSKISLHIYLLLALLPIPKFIHKDMCTRSLLHDRLIHQALNEVLELLKTAAHVGIMMNDPTATYIADTPELSLVACTDPKASLFTTAMLKNFGDSVPHPPHIGSHTLTAICRAREKSSTLDYKALVFSDESLGKLTDALQLFHNHKDAIVQASVRNNSWEIPKLELLQSMVSSIQCSGPAMQWSTDATKHAHVQEIKVPARLSNNQNYYNQIAYYLDRSDKCFHFNVATYLEAQREQTCLPNEDDLDFDREDDQDNDIESDTHSLSEHMNLSLHTTVDEAAILFEILDLHPVIWEFLQHVQNCTNHDVLGNRTQNLNCPLPFDRIQVWYKLCVQQFLYHMDQRVDAPQTLRAFPPSPDRPHGLYDSVVISPGSDSDWPQQGIEALQHCLLTGKPGEHRPRDQDAFTQMGNNITHCSHYVRDKLLTGLSTAGHTTSVSLQGRFILLFPPSSTTLGGINSIITHMNQLWQRVHDCWAYYPDISVSDDLEEKVAQFFNGIVQHVPDSYLCTRQWTGKALGNPMDGLSGAIRKPDLLLCEGAIMKHDARKEKFDIGSISTHSLDIHQFPGEFLRILLGLTFADGIMLGFNYTISPTQNSQKKIQILMQKKEYNIIVDTLLFFSGSLHSLHSRGMTVWSGKVTIDGEEEDVVDFEDAGEGQREVRAEVGPRATAHRDALKDADILHRDISLFNLFLVLIHDDLSTDFINRVLQEPERSNIHAKIQSIPHCGLLGDWGYAIPVNVSPSDKFALGITPAVHVDSEKQPISQTDLKDMHSIVIPIADKSLSSNSGFSMNASPLQRTETWVWMAAELSHIGPGTLVVHQSHHDLESFFYILLAICLLYDVPGKLKPPKVLAQCFNPFFAVVRPSTLKVVTVQSDFGWTALMLPYVSQYFQPLIALLGKIQEKLILPIKFQGDKFQANHEFAHDDFIDAIVVVLSKLPNKYWIAKELNTTANTMPQNTSTSSTTPILSIPSATSSMVLPNHPLPRLPQIRISNTSSASSSKHHLEHEDEANS
ncbi:hypothetical protein HD554DRAFT_2037123 [Boletus coccyginus]|nr:hypothetical protein HD554DRAFT_2037123 [Boletus coccyginus]